MAIETKVLFSLFLVSSCLVSASTEPQDPKREYQQCLQQCQQTPGQKERQQCRERCDEEAIEQHRHHGSIVLNTEEEESRDPQREYQQCQEQCQQTPGQKERQQCRERCDAEAIELHRHHGSIVLNTEEEESRDPASAYQQCQNKCRVQHGHLQKSCLRRCNEQYKHDDNIKDDDPDRDVDKALQQCEQKCPVGQQQQCQQTCKCLNECNRPVRTERKSICQQKCLRQSNERRGDNFEDETQEGSQEEGENDEGGRPSRRKSKGEGKESQGGEQQKENENPYLFRQERFQTKVRGKEGEIRVLERFNSKSSLLKGIKNYRISITGINPNTVMLPNHRDANSVCIVLYGRGAITILSENKNETYNVERGDIFRIQAGVTIYIMNTDGDDNLIIPELTIPVNTPGEFESFHTVGVQDQESYYRAFSDEILQSAFNVPSDQVKRLFDGQKNQGVFVKASPQQIRAMSQGSSIPWPGSESQQYTYNLLKQRPSQSSRYGQLNEAKPNDFQQLQDLDVGVSFAKIPKGGMFGPFYNSRSTKIAMVVRGGGSFEMACPHMSQQQQGQRGQEYSQQDEQRGSGITSYQKFRARVSQGDVFVVPAGHPIVTVASNNWDLEVLCFEINSQNNKRIPLAGTNSILKQMGREAKELSFNIPARQVDEILNKRQESWFFPGPQQSQQQGGQDLA